MYLKVTINAFGLLRIQLKGLNQLKGQKTKYIYCGNSIIEKTFSERKNPSKLSRLLMSF